VDAHAEARAVAEVRLHDVAEPMQVDDDVLDAVTGELAHGVLDQRTAADFEHRLGTSCASVAEPRRGAGREQHGLPDGRVHASRGPTTDGRAPRAPRLEAGGRRRRCASLHPWSCRNRAAARPAFEAIASVTGSDTSPKRLTVIRHAMHRRIEEAASDDVLGAQRLDRSRRR
jgi:hypothetical protein